MNSGILLIVMCIGAVVSAVVASSKNRSAGGWAVVGALFPLISLIVLLAVERLPDDPMRP